MFLRPFQFANSSNGGGFPLNLDFKEEQSPGGSAYRSRIFYSLKIHCAIARGVCREGTQDPLINFLTFDASWK